MTAPLVTIGIPCFNEERHIHDALKSAVCQTYSNIEILIADAGSSDNTLNHINECKENYNISVIHNKKGTTPFDNWRSLISECNGDYLLILVASHEINPDCIKKLITPFLKNTNLGYVRGSIVYKHKNGIKEIAAPLLRTGIYSCKQELAKLVSGNVCETISTLYKVAPLKEALPFDTRLNRTFVWLTNAKIAAKYPVYFYNIDVAIWNDNETIDSLKMKNNKLLTELSTLYYELKILMTNSGLHINIEEYYNLKHKAIKNNLLLYNDLKYDMPFSEILKINIKNLLLKFLRMFMRY